MAGAGPARIDALRAGHVDIAMNLERVERRRDFDPGFHWVQAPNAASVIYYLNAFGGLFAQPDRPAYVREVRAKQIGDMAIFDSTPCSTFRVLDDKVSATTRGALLAGA